LLTRPEEPQGTGTWGKTDPAGGSGGKFMPSMRGSHGIVMDPEQGKNANGRGANHPHVECRRIKRGDHPEGGWEGT